jgi:hypothetical protein
MPDIKVPKVYLLHEHQCFWLLKNIFFGIPKNTEIEYAHTYGHSKDRIEISVKNMLYFELYKKTKFCNFFVPIHNHKFVFFL